MENSVTLTEVEKKIYEIWKDSFGDAEHVRVILCKREGAGVQEGISSHSLQYRCKGIHRQSIG